MRFVRTVLALFITLASASAPALATVADHATPMTMAMAMSSGDHAPMDGEADSDALPDCCEIEDKRVVSCRALPTTPNPFPTVSPSTAPSRISRLHPFLRSSPAAPGQAMTSRFCSKA